MSAALSFLAGFILVFGIGLVMYCKVMLEIDEMLDDSLEEDKEKWE
tara:strand:+ start:8922 stop:9059 length:138 start_codon:yes stop_codon:yes gene_type:complete